MSTKASKETRSAASRSRMVQVAKSRVESSLQSQSSDNEPLSNDTYESERSVQTTLPVVRTSKPSLSKNMKSKIALQQPSSPISASALRNDEDDEDNEGEFSPSSEDRVPIDHSTRKRIRSFSQRHHFRDY